MAKLIYAAITSLDGYVADANGKFDWGEPDEEVHSFVNDLERPVGTHLYGRRMYEVMVAWESPDIHTGQPPPMKDYAEIWRAAEKIVYSRTLEEVSSERTRIEREFDRSGSADQGAGGIRPRRRGPRPRRRGVHGRLGRRVPVVPRADRGRGRQPIPPRRPALELELLDERRFGNGMVYLRYGTR